MPSANDMFSKIEELVCIEQLFFILTLKLIETFFPMKLFIFSFDFEAIDTLGIIILKSPTDAPLKMLQLLKIQFPFPNLALIPINEDGCIKLMHLFFILFNFLMIFNLKNLFLYE